MSLFYQVTDVESAEFFAALEIYDEAFPECERTPAPYLTERIKLQLDRLFVSQEDERIVFMAILGQPILDEFVLVGYMATHSHFRNRGLGSVFIKQTLERVAKNSQYLLFEVEDPEIGFDREIRRRRVNFYRRLGAKQMKDVRYILPPLSGAESTQMRLMLAPEYPENRIAGERVKQLITHLYVNFYERPVDDPVLRSSLKEIGEWVELV